MCTFRLYLKDIHESRQWDKFQRLANPRTGLTLAGCPQFWWEGERSEILWRKENDNMMKMKIQQFYSLIIPWGRLGICPFKDLSKSIKLETTQIPSDKWEKNIYGISLKGILHNSKKEQ